MWSKILAHKVNGKVFKVIFNMYNGIKSCVSVMGRNSPFFSSFAGVRQGENLSPVLFSMYLNDLENFLQESQINGISLDLINDEITHFSKLVVLLYADDTVLLADNEQELQNSLDAFYDYCERWKLKINMNKTKVVIFGARKTDSYRFTLGNDEVEISDRYKYLGIFFFKVKKLFKCTQAHSRAS